MYSKKSSHAKKTGGVDRDEVALGHRGLAYLEGTPQRVSPRKRNDSLISEAHPVEHVPQVVLRLKKKNTHTHTQILIHGAIATQQRSVMVGGDSLKQLSQGTLGRVVGISLRV